MNGFFFFFLSFWFWSVFLHNTYQYHGLEWRRNVCIKMRTEKNMLIFGEWFFCHLAWCIFRSNWKHDLEWSEINSHFVKWTNALPYFDCRTINSPLLIHFVFTYICLYFSLLQFSHNGHLRAHWNKMDIKAAMLAYFVHFKHNKLKQYWLWCNWDIVIFTSTSCTLTSDKIW